MLHCATFGGFALKFPRFWPTSTGSQRSSLLAAVCSYHVREPPRVTLLGWPCMVWQWYPWSRSWLVRRSKCGTLTMPPVVGSSNTWGDGGTSWMKWGPHLAISRTRPRVGLLWRKLSLPLPKSFSVGVECKSPLTAIVFLVLRLAVKLLQGFHGTHCRQLETTAGSVVNSCTHSATGSLCCVYAWFHCKMDIPGKDNCYRRIILPTGRYDQEHTDPITDLPIVTGRRRQKPACSTPSCRRPWPDQSCEGPGTRAGTLREYVSAIDKSDRTTAAIAWTSMWPSCRQPFCSLKPATESHQRGTSKSTNHPITAVATSHGHLLRQECLPLAHCLAYDQSRVFFAQSCVRDALCMRYNWQPDHLPSHCSCGQAFSLDHALSCVSGGYSVMQHNELRDFAASVLQEVCKDVALEPPLQPLGGEQLRRPANATQEARLDISARGFWVWLLQPVTFWRQGVPPERPICHTSSSCEPVRKTWTQQETWVWAAGLGAWRRRCQLCAARNFINRRNGSCLCNNIQASCRPIEWKAWLPVRRHAELVTMPSLVRAPSFSRDIIVRFEASPASPTNSTSARIDAMIPCVWLFSSACLLPDS